MSRTRFDHMNCGIAQALDVLGDWWTLLIVRDAFFGVRRFSDFQSDLGIAKNLLSDRLQRLVDNEILERREVGATGARCEYHLTPKGEALLPVLTSLREWSDEWIYGAGNEPVVVKHRATGKPLPKLVVRDSKGRPVGRRELRTVAGPGADDRTRALLGDRR